MTAHASLAPSASDKWGMCAGYVQAVADLADETSKPAAEGTAAHHVSDSCLALGMTAHDFIGQTIHVEGFDFEWTEYDADLLQYGIDRVRSFGGKFYGEQRIDISRWLGPNQFGTLDRAIITDDKRIIINDLKWGRGIPVSPVHNWQLGLYALGFWNDIARHITDARDFLLIIDQPRNAGGGGEWPVSLDELLAFGETAKGAAEASRMPNPPLTAGIGCRYCPRAKAPGGCPALDTFNLDLLGIAPDDLDGGAITLDTESPVDRRRRSVLLQFKPLLKTWLDKMEEDALAEALAGETLPLLKAVSGRRPPRKWLDDKAAEATLTDDLGDDAIEHKVKSPTKIEKMLGRTEFAEKYGSLIEIGDPKPILVSDKDDRPALKPISDQFADLPE